MKTLPALFVLIMALTTVGFSQPAVSTDAATLAELARGHEQVFKTLTGDRTTIVLQKAEKQFTIFGVTNVRAVGSILEITVKNGDKYSVSPADVFFITNNPFKI